MLVSSKSPLRDFIHGRDHAITQGHALGQRLVWETYKATFGDTNVYEQLPMQPSQAEVFLRNTMSRPFLRRYKWGVNARTSGLPIAYVLLKQKNQKDFKAARPIISYIHFLYAKLFRATAIALDLILRSVCPRSFGLDTLPSILQKMTVFLQQLPDDADPVVYNQDLVGFFTSIPVFRILNAVRWAVAEYRLIKNVDVDPTSFSVNLQEQDTKLRIWKRRPRKAAKRTVLVHLSDIVDICELSCLQSCIRSFVSVEVQQLGVRFPQCLLVLLFQLRKRSMYDTCITSSAKTKSCSFALGTLTIDLLWYPDGFFKIKGYFIF